MKIILAIIIGLGLAGLIASKVNDEQRAKVGDAAGKAVGSVKDSKLASTVKDKTSTAAGSAADSVDSAADSVSDAAEAVEDAT